MDSRSLVTLAIAGIALVGIAAGGLPKLRMNRATIALTAATLLVAAGSLRTEEAFAAIDLDTIALILAMMIIVSNLRIAGFFTAAGAKALSLARTPRQFLAIVVVASGLLSALFLNDTICLMMTPLVLEMALRARRDPLPYLIGLATGANVGSCATIIGNPQNMFIASRSGIPFLTFLSKLGPPSALGIIVCWVLVQLTFPREFKAPVMLEAPDEPSRGTVDRAGLVKGLVSAAILLACLLLGVRPALAALIASSLLLVTRRVHPERVFAEVDFTLLVFFAGLFVITEAIRRTRAFESLVSAILPALGSSLGSLSLSTILLSNLVSNVPAVMLLEPLASGSATPEKAWLILAMASTFAGNLTLLGSVANLIVAECAKTRGVSLGFGKYLRAGLPITLATAAIGTLWLLFIA